MVKDLKRIEDYYFLCKKYFLTILNPIFTHAKFSSAKIRKKNGN